MPSPQVSNGQIDTKPPTAPVKLILIHHSTGGHWLADPAINELGGGLFAFPLGFVVYGRWGTNTKACVELFDQI